MPPWAAVLRFARSVLNPPFSYALRWAPFQLVKSHLSGVFLGETEVGTPFSMPTGHARRAPQDVLVIYSLTERTERHHLADSGHRPLTSLSPPTCHPEAKPLSQPQPPKVHSGWGAGGGRRESLHGCIGEREGGKRRRGQRQVGPHVKGAGAGSYYLLGSRCPQASPGSAGSSATEHRGTVLEQA